MNMTLIAAILSGVGLLFVDITKIFPNITNSAVYKVVNTVITEACQLVLGKPPGA